MFGPDLVHIRKVRREDMICSTWQKLKVSKWHQMTTGSSTGDAETLGSYKSLEYFHRAASFITSPTAHPGYTPGKGDEDNKMSYAPVDTACSHLHGECFSNCSG